MLKILRVLPLLKVFKASSIIQPWENSFRIAMQSTVPSHTLGGFAFLMVVMLHWFACIIYIYADILLTDASLDMGQLPAARAEL